MERVALYCRVSTTEQAKEGYSLQEQEKRLRLYAEAHGWIIGECYTDAGYSGAKLERPAMARLIDDAQHRRISKVIVFKLDRLSRSQKDTLYLIEDVFLKNGVDFVSMSETIDTSTPFGIAMIGILSVFAQLERETIKERMTIGRDAAIKSGNYHGVTSKPLFGFTGENGKLVPNEYEQSLVRRVYDLFNAGHTKREISRIMEAESPARSTPWEPIRVTRILTNPIYIGQQLWKGELYQCTDVTPVIDIDTWNAARQRINRQKTGTNHHAQTATHSRHLLSGMLFCAKCGRRYNGVIAHNGNGKEYRYYRCNGTTAYKNAEGSCGSPHIPMDYLDDLVIAEIKKLSASPDLITEDTAAATRAAERIASIKQRLREITNAQRRLIDLYAAESIDKSILLERSASLQSERSKLESTLIEAEANTPTTPSTFRADLTTFTNLITQSATTQDLSPIIHSLIQSITITNTDIHINWSI